MIGDFVENKGHMVFKSNSQGGRVQLRVQSMITFLSTEFSDLYYGIEEFLSGNLLFFFGDHFSQIFNEKFIKSSLGTSDSTSASQPRKVY